MWKVKIVRNQYFLFFPGFAEFVKAISDKVIGQVDYHR
jgi:hypothetical protein